MNKAIKTKKTICIFIFFSIVLPFLFSCSQNSGKTDQSESANENGVDEKVAGGEENAELRESFDPNIEAFDFGGYAFTILTTDDGLHDYPLHTRDIYAEEETGEPMNDATYRRNRETENKFNIQIKMAAEPEPNGPYDALKKAVNAGEDIYDLFLAFEMGGSGPAAANGFLLNWENIPCIDLSKPYWSSEVAEQLSVGNKMFLALSDLSVGSNEYLYAVFFNKQVQKENGVENLYEIVKSGHWTLDKAAEVSKDIAKDLNGDGIMDEEDQWGIIMNYGAQGLFYSCGNMVMRKDENNIPYIEYVTERSINSFDKAFELCRSDYTIYEANWTLEAKYFKIFSENRALLMFKYLTAPQILRGMETDFGILPYPKLDSAQEKYYSFMDGHTLLMGIPIMVSNLDRTGAIIEEMSFLSYKYLVPAYYDVLLKTKFSRDNESAEMLDIIYSGRIFDFGYVYDNWIISYTFQSQIDANKREFASVVEKNMGKAQANLEKILAAYEAVQ
ncbi:MAG: hypothetical protein FWG34_09475 [Oscillospiraceae bacterium]|nr:hypothetical protein [Oscillospiraceae bacterium]